MAKISKEKFKTFQNVFDEFTNRTLFKLISQGHFDGLESPVSIGKEANIFTAKKGDSKVIVKIYRLEACDFNKMFDYIKEDPRYLNLAGKKRKIILAWVQREYRNLLIAREAGVNVPTPIIFFNNILVLEFIGGNEIAPKLKDLEPKNPKKFLDEIVQNMQKINKAGLVHADLSSFNILNHEDHPVFIDFSQTSSVKISRYDEFLRRDIKNIASHFKKLGIKVDEEKLIGKIKKSQFKKL